MEPIIDAFRRLLRLGRAAKGRALPVWKAATVRFARLRQWPRLRRRWAAGISIAAVLFIGFVLGFVWFVLGGGPSWYGKRYAALAPLLALFGSLVVGLGTITVGALLARAALRQARTATHRHEEQTRADLQRRITETFSKAVEQLGSDKLEVRLGGIYSLERISKESPDDYWTVMENLTAFVRERSRRNEQRVARRAYFLWEAAGWPDGRADDFWTTAAREEDLGEPAADIAAVLTVIKRRSEQSRELEGANDWRFDLSGAILKRCDLRGAHLEGANLNAAHLEGAFLRIAHLEGARLWDTHLEGAYLTSVPVCKYRPNSMPARSKERREQWGSFQARSPLLYHQFPASGFWSAIATRDTSAHLKGAQLIRAHLKRADLAAAHLERAHLWGADLRGATGLSEEQLRVAYGDHTTKLPEGMHWSTLWPVEET